MCVTRASSVDDSVALAAAMSAACSFSSFVRAFSMATRTASARCPSATSSCTREAASEVKRARNSANLAACAVHNRVFAVGGWDGKQDVDIVESLRLDEGKWREEAALEIPRSNLAAAVLWR